MTYEVIFSPKSYKQIESFDEKLKGFGGDLTYLPVTVLGSLPVENARLSLKHLLNHCLPLQ